MLGWFDLLAAALLLPLDAHPAWVPPVLIAFHGYFLLFKGITSVVRLPIWFGPLAFFAGIVDTLSGAMLYVAGSEGSLLGHVGMVLGVFLLMKGGFTVVFGLVAR